MKTKKNVEKMTDEQFNLLMTEHKRISGMTDEDYKRIAATADQRIDEILK